MMRIPRCFLASLLAIAAIVSLAVHNTEAAGTITETLAFTFLTPSLGWRVTDRWNSNSGARGPLTVQRTTDGGLHWQIISTVTGAGARKNDEFNVYASSLLFADPHDGWLYGNRLYVTHDGGHTWQRLPLHGTETQLSAVGRSIWRLDSSCGADNHCRSAVLASTAGSNAWQVLSWHPPRGVSDMGVVLARADALHAWITGLPHMVGNRMVLRLFATTDGGTTWHARPMPCARAGFAALTAQLVPYTATNLWLFCASEPGAGSQLKSVFRSSDGAQTWRLVSNSGFGAGRPGLGNLSIGGYLNSAAVTTPSDAWLALGRGTLLRTTDGGRIWRPAIPYAQDNPTDGGVGPVLFVDARHGWLLSFPDLLFRTVDGGRHWEKIKLE